MFYFLFYFISFHFLKNAKRREREVLSFRAVCRCVVRLPVGSGMRDVPSCVGSRFRAVIRSRSGWAEEGL